MMALNSHTFRWHFVAFDLCLAEKVGECETKVLICKFGVCDCPQNLTGTLGGLFPGFHISHLPSDSDSKAVLLGLRIDTYTVMLCSGFNKPIQQSAKER